MKAKELMFGDIVLIEGTPRIVVQITKHKIGYHRTELPFGECKMSYARLADVAPIPLTPKILKKNGFRVEEEVEDEFMGLCNCYSIDDDSVVIYWADSYNTMTCAGTEDFVKEQWKLEVYGQGGTISMYGPKLYIHQLQQALRICGLNDLADSIII